MIIFFYYYVILDKNECTLAADNDCVDDADCTNTEGSYTCKCKDGFEGDDAKVLCTGKRKITI